MTADWYDERSNVAELMDWLDDRAELTIDIAIQIVEKPWHFTPEYDQMRKGQAEFLERTEVAA